jgi:hypothetical protein
VLITNCTNTGDISGGSAGGIAGSSAASSNGSVIFTNCTNSGVISGNYAGGIAGNYAGYSGGSVGFTDCTNTGNISGQTAGGIAGYGAGFGNGNASSAIFTDCMNTGQVSGSEAGGISGSLTGSSSGSATFTNCANTGIISGQAAGGIVGNKFAENTTTTSSISNCYSIGNITGDSAGGIVGALIGYTNNASFNPIVDISNCYSLGAIATTCGGICGGNRYSSVYTGTPTINITNCYSWGNVTNAGSGIVALGLPIATTQNDIYVANGSWSDASANAVGALTGFPTDISTNNPGPTWTTIASNTPYVLSSFNAQLYDPNSASSSSSSYTTESGEFVDPSYNYQIVYNSQSINIATTRVFVAKGSTPYYYSYNNNTFEFINSNPATSTESIDVSITPSNGVLNLNVACFKKGTKILCGNEICIPIEELKIGDLVKTYKHGYQKVIMFAHSILCENFKNKVNKLYTYPREKNPDLIEDLHLTGGHSLLMDALTEEESTNMQNINWVQEDFMVEDKYKLLSWYNEKLYVSTEQNVEIYHFTLEPPENAKPSYVYGIYANGILAESCSKGAMEQVCNNK